MQSRETGAVVLAAGAGRRMGKWPKSLLERDGEALLLRQIRLLDATRIDHIAIVLGHHAARIASALDQTATAAGMARAVRCMNADPDRGTASSLRCGLAALPENLAAWLVLLGDQPLLEVEDLQYMLAAWQARAPDTRLIVPCHQNQPGHPVVFGKMLRDAMMTNATSSVREWRHNHARQTQSIKVHHARYTIDVDTPTDIVRLLETAGVKLDFP